MNLVINHKTTLEQENIELYGMVFGAIEYYSLYALCLDRAYTVEEAEDDSFGFEILGVHIMMDPLRDSGEPVLLFRDRDALRLLSERTP